MITLKEYLKSNYPQIFHLTITGKCNAFCEGCINSLIYGERSSILKDWEGDPERDFEILNYLLNASSNGSPVYIAFYGGEPLLAFDKIRILTEKIDQRYRNKNFKLVIYTNGMLLDKVLSKDREFFKRIELLIVSIDGRDKQHNLFRKGTKLSKIEKNLELLREEVKTPVLMWSTIREEMSLGDCLFEFLKLFNQGLVDYFYWHLIEKDKPIEKFENFKFSYLSDLRMFFEEFINCLRKGTVLPLLPVCELTYFLAKQIRRGHTACGIEEFRNFDILGGKVIPCVDLGDEFLLGELTKEGFILMDQVEVEKGLRKLVKYKKNFGCERCEAEFYCGGRCPVLIKTSLERAKQYCELTRSFVDLGREFLPEILKILKQMDLNLTQIYYPYGYLVLLTDVVP
ncbi:MAG: 4Fe-4S cluster-binding domain-containing protein [Thermodesulfobacteriaceae bacterium]|nr:4Fe-4S cluster-binding domain-containing protein [Thermodesulfobacteriaceae bacterium]MCX8040860.1 4Fe-4S cluster-binding domain-containing protein [Thermodesulfobacteriaceae bacterium]MDW8136262.1 4Fe-4S cluster-binding domain-containing protein [Thermodesulfobacterium sp.]